MSPRKATLEPHVSPEVAAGDTASQATPTEAPVPETQPVVEATQAPSKVKTPKVKTPKPKGIDSAVANYLEGLQKQFGPEAGFVLTEDSPIPEVPVIPTGVAALDLALGCGGIPRGRIIEFYGPEMSGKTTLALQCAAQAQVAGEMVQFIDAEHALDLSYAEHLGVNLGKMIVSQPDNGEQALSIAEFAVDNMKGGGLVIVDSVAALVPKSEIEGDMGDAQMGIQARLMSQALRKLTGAASKNDVTIIFINQLRMKIGVMFGNPETTTGGNALKFYASVRIDIRKGKPIKTGGDEGDVIGQETRVKIVKNKCAPPFRECTFNLIYGEGYDRLASLLDVAIDRGVVKQAGAWLTFGDGRWQGKKACRAAIEADPTIGERIAEAI